MSNAGFLLQDPGPVPPDAPPPPDDPFVDGLTLPEEGPVGRSIHAGTVQGANGLTIRVGRTAGFCYGVRRAVEMAWGAVGRSKEIGRRVATLGPVIHNPQEVERLERDGAVAIAYDDLGRLDDGDLLVIRAHGIPKDERAAAKAKGLTVVDATCPYVRRPQMLAERAAKDGCLVVLVGDPLHPEILGVRSFALAAGGRCEVVRGPDQVAALPDAPSVAVLVQTTQKRELFEAVVEACRARFSSVRAIDTICDDTTERQADVRELASGVDVMLVVGGRLSANTAKLAEIATHFTARTHLIERAEEVEPRWFDGARTVGIAAGASTPDWLVGEIVHAVGRLPV